MSIREVSSRSARSLNEPQQISLRGRAGRGQRSVYRCPSGADPNAEVDYRLYYETVHWVKASGIIPGGWKHVVLPAG